MNIVSANSQNLTKQYKLFSESSSIRDYIWENLIIERRISVNWIYKIYKGSIVEHFWMVLSSSVK